MDARAVSGRQHVPEMVRFRVLDMDVCVNDHAAGSLLHQEWGYNRIVGQTVSLPDRAMLAD